MSDKIPTVDLHAHVIPHIDHGCKDVSEALSQLKLMKEYGTDIVVATPHFYPHIHRVEDFVHRLDLSIEELKQLNLTDTPTLKLGAEVLLCENLAEMESLSKLCIRGTRVLLIELPNVGLGDGHIETVEDMIDSGYTVVLAHVDRYVTKFPDIIEALFSIGAFAQVNADAVTHPAVMHKIKKYLSHTDRICGFGSDLHGSSRNSYKHFAHLPKTLHSSYDSVAQAAVVLLEGSENII